MAKTRSREGESRPHRVQVSIGGETFWLKGDAPAAHMERLAARVDSVLQSVLGRDPSMPRYRAAILAAIHLAHELEERGSRTSENGIPSGRKVVTEDET